VRTTIVKDKDDGFNLVNLGSKVPEERNNCVARCTFIDYVNHLFALVRDSAQDCPTGALFDRFIHVKRLLL
jgi:hypothetical protein